MSDISNNINPDDALAAIKAMTTGADAAERLKDKAKAGQVERFQTEERSFLSPHHPNGKFLVKVGDVEYAPFQSQSLGMKPAVVRHGDIMIRFSSGVVTTADPEILAWLEAHSGDAEAHFAYHTDLGQKPQDCTVPIGLCRESGPGIDVWAELKMGQVPTASRPATISPEIDIDAFMNGQYSTRNSRSLTRGDGARMADAVENAANATADRAQGQRNDV